MVSEIDYLYAALEKAGFAVMVRQFDSPKKVRRSKLLYLSDNIETLGMNVKNIVKGKDMNIKDESMRDNLMDIANYCVLTIMELDNQK